MACGYAIDAAGGALRRRHRRDGAPVSTRPHQQETKRDAGPAPGARPSGTWPCSGPWPPSPSSGARPSPRPRGRRARTWAFLNTVSGRAFAASSAATSASLRVSKLSFILGVSCAAARGAAAGRARQPATDAFFAAPHCPAAPRGVRRHRAGSRGGLRGGEAAQLVCRTLHEHPFTATLGLETLRGAKAVALPARARTRAVFICKSTPCFFVEQGPRRYGVCQKVHTAGSCPNVTQGGHTNTAPGRRRAVSGGPASG